MNFIYIFFLILLYIKELKGNSKGYYECLYPDKVVNSADECIKINIIAPEDFKCCSMKISYKNNSSYSCIALEKKYITSKEELNKYISKRSLVFLFAITGGQMEIDCGLNMKITENYKKISNESLNCYNSHIKGVKNINECNDNDIPVEDNSKCCFVETSKINDDGNILNDKRCYIIQNEYFTKEKNFTNYLLDESNVKNLNEINNTNISINCKNYEPFFFQGVFQKPSNTTKNDNSTTDPWIPINPESNNKSGLKSWAIALIIICCCIFISGIIITIYFIYNKQKRKKKEDNKTESNLSQGNTYQIKNNQTSHL